MTIITTLGTIGTGTIAGTAAAGGAVVGAAAAGSPTATKVVELGARAIDASIVGASIVGIAVLSNPIGWGIMVCWGPTISGGTVAAAEIGEFSEATNLAGAHMSLDVNIDAFAF